MGQPVRTLQMPHTPYAQGGLVSYFCSGDAVRSRSVGHAVLSGAVHVPVPPARLVADWQREVTTRLGLAPGEVEALALARTRVRWPDLRCGVQAASSWTDALGLSGLLASCSLALMACRGASYHHDGGQYGGMAFCNLFLSEDCGLDVHFPSTGQRIPLSRGTIVLFDTCQPHAVIKRGSRGFDADDFPPEQDSTQVFLTWELPIENTAVAHALGVTFDIDPAAVLPCHEEQVWHNGARVSVCPTSGQWCPHE